MNSLSFDTHPFDLWILCGINGSCADLTPLGMILGGAVQKITLKHNQTTDDFNYSERNLPTHRFDPSPVCVWPPFMWIVSNATQNDTSSTNNTLICSEGSCFYTLCWDAEKFHTAVITRMPRFVPVPVDTPGTLTLFRQKRDFGISAIIVSIVATLAVSASLTASALALQGQVQTANAINNLSATVTTALDKQMAADVKVQGGLLLVNQRIDLVQEQLDVLWQIAQLGCEQKFPGLCVTSIQYNNFTRAANLSRSLSRYMLQVWNADFEQTLQELRMAIIQVNSTRLDLSLTEGFSTWISSAISYFKEWVGVGLFGAVLCCGLVFTLWLVYRLRTQAKRDKVIISQALAAIESGDSSDVWLTMLRQ